VVERVAAWRLANPEKAQAQREREKPASRARAAAWYEANKDRHFARERAKRGADPVSYRANQRKYQATWLAKPGNKAKARAWVAAWGKAHPEKMHAYQRAWYVENVDALREVKRCRSRLYAASPFTFEDWLEILEVHNHRCAYCLCNDRPLTMDHVIPISKGGEHSADNIVPACRPCNSRKGNRPVFLMVA